MSIYCYMPGGTAGNTRCNKPATYIVAIRFPIGIVEHPYCTDCVRGAFYANRDGQKVVSVREIAR